MGSRVKGITIELGGDTTGLDKALESTDKKIRSTQASLKDVNRLLKLDPKNTELLRQKFTLLSQEVELNEDKLTSLKEAEKQVQKQFEAGDIGQEQYDALKREVIETENKINYLKNAAKDAEKELSKVDEKSIEEVAKAADKAEKNLEDAGKEASNFSDYLKADAIVEAGKAIVGALGDVAEESKEYLKIMGSLEVSSQAAGYTAEETAETYKTLYGVLADEQSAATTTANLQAIGLSQEELVEMTNMAIGAWSKYGDSIPIDGLAEALNETIKVGTATGNFCDLLSWAGESEDAFNEKLAACTTEAERADLVMQLMASQGLSQAGEAWQTNNQALVENNAAQAEMQEQVALLGETVMPVFTSITEVVAGALAMFNSLDGTSKALIVTAGILIGLLIGLPSIITTITTATAAMNAVFAANPVGLVIAAIVALGTAFTVLWRNCEGFRNFWITLWEGIKTGARSGANGLISLLNGVIGALNVLINGANKIKFDVPDWVPGIGGKEFGFNIKTIGKIAYLKDGGTLVDGSAIVGEAGPEFLTVSHGRAHVQPLSGSATAGIGLNDVLNVLNTYLPYLAESTQMVLDTGTLVGELTPEINNELGRIARMERYR